VGASTVLVGTPLLDPGGLAPYVRMACVKRTITGVNANGSMSLGDLRQFIASLDGLPDEASVKARVSFRKHLRSVTVEEEDLGFSDYMRAVGTDGAEGAKSAAAKSPDTTAGPREARDSRKVRQVKQTTSS
jgi:hypothetical protein